MSRKPPPITVTAVGKPPRDGLDRLVEYVKARLDGKPPAEASVPPPPHVAPPRPTSVDLFLSHAELVTLTGYRRGAEQITWLKNRHWRYETNAAGAPRVARAYFERRMVGEVKSAEPPATARHNFAALHPTKK